MTTGPDGSYVLTNLPLGTTRVTLQAAGHADDSFSADLNANLGRQRISRELHAVGYQQSFNPGSAQVLQDSTSVARLSLPANALVSASEAAPVGTVTLGLTRNDPGPDSDPTTLRAGTSRVRSVPSSSMARRPSPSAMPAASG